MKYISIILLSLIPLSALTQQRPDTTFSINIPTPKYELNNGPVVCIDSSHNNFHTLDGGFSPFAKVLRKDGYRVADLNSQFNSTKVFSKCALLVISNPLHESNIGNWVLPNPSAFTGAEIQSLKNWIEEGGSLFLIADHMPFAGAASELGKAIGVDFSNGFATLEKQENQPDLFDLENERLLKGPVSGTEANVTSVTSFTGSAFTIPENAIPVMRFKPGDFSLEPDVAWQFEEDTKTTDISDHYQGALLKHGEGRVAVFGEAAMFTAQVITSGNNEFKVGLNNQDLAPQNIRFLLNIIHWLDSE